MSHNPARPSQRPRARALVRIGPRAAAATVFIAAALDPPALLGVLFFPGWLFYPPAIALVVIAVAMAWVLVATCFQRLRVDDAVIAAALAAMGMLLVMMTLEGQVGSYLAYALAVASIVAYAALALVDHRWSATGPASP